MSEQKNIQKKMFTKKKVWMSGNMCYESILDVIGNTPLVRLNKITAEVESSIYAKLEFLNPMGSSKDRIARYMIEKAETEGRIKKGDLIIENSSGNTAIALALIAIQKGYKLKVVVRDTISKEKYDQLLALGVEVLKVDSKLPPESPDSYNNITPRLAKETKNCYFPDQHNNLENNDAHYYSTGPEIWEQTKGNMDYFIGGIGTCGTVCGVARYLKEKNPKIKIIAIDIAGSIFYDYFHTGRIVPSHPYFIEGLGDEFLIKTADFSFIDDMYQVTDKEAIEFCRLLAKTEGLLVGGSSGAAIWGALKLAKSLQKPARIITLFPDSASRYLSTLFNDNWLKEIKLQ